MNFIDPTLDGDTKVWRYMDLAKFIHMITYRELYFPSIIQLHKNDPFEGFLPRRSVESKRRQLRSLVSDLERIQKRACEQGAQTQMEQAIENIKRYAPTSHIDLVSRLRISCWYQSDDESYAMWKIYSSLGQGIAIETTINDIVASLIDRDDIHVQRIIYMDYDDHDPVDSELNGIFTKRTCFEYEKEVRVAIFSDDTFEGLRVPCDLNSLVQRIHISPFTDGFVIDAIQKLCSAKIQPLDKPIVSSRLLENPDYDMRLDF